MPTIRAIKADELAKLSQSDCFIIDVRTPMEHDEKHIKRPHAFVPLDMLNPTEVAQKNNLSKDANIYILCRSGKRATAAAERFVAEGYTNATVIEGGILACEECGHDLGGYGAKSAESCCASHATRTPISLERQVRIAAGIIIAVGSLLTLTIGTGFAYIPLALGCGLIFAGVTDRCGLALILTKAPWNKR